MLDLKSPQDRALLRRMLTRADVLVQNLAPGALDRMGLTAQVLQAEFPRLIVASIQGYGSDTAMRRCGPMTCWCRPKVGCVR